MVADAPHCVVCRVTTFKAMRAAEALAALDVRWFEEPVSSDDLEGFSEHDGLFYGVISAGWIYTWKRAGSGFQLVDGPYALGPVDLSAKKNAKHPPPGDGMVCDAHGVNCGRNYEGLCLAHAANADGCAGYVASKSDGHLYCVAFDASHRLVVRRDGAIYVDEPARLD